MIPGPSSSGPRLQYFQANDPETPGPQLKSLAATAKCPILLASVAANISTPNDTIKSLAFHENVDVRIGVIDNPSVTSAILDALVQDSSDDVRFALAENHNTPAHILFLLLDDENPYVSVRAANTIERLKLEFGSNFGKTDTRPEFDFDRADKEESGLITLLIAEDNEFVRSLIKRSLNSHHRILVVADVADGKTTVSSVLKHQPKVVLMDIGMPVIDGVAATRMIKEALPDTRIIMVTARDRAEDINNAFEAGADGYYLKTSALSELAQAIVTVADGGKWLDPGISSTILRKCLSRHPIAVAGVETKPATADEDKTSLALEILSYETERLFNANKIGEALAVCKAALAVAIAQYGRDSKEAVSQLSTLAELHYIKEDYRSSESLMLQAIRNREDLLSNADQETDHLINFLGQMSEASGNFQQAELYYSWSLRIRERLGQVVKVDEARDKLSSLLEEERLQHEPKEL
ncbi:MAG: response regulator [Candidatus Melainabacteria bacterium]|nr:response regulator [Candidatus Melainabacteria bacterium]